MSKSEVNRGASGHILYSAAELGVSAIESFLRLYLLIFLTDKIGLSADLAGYAVGIGILWDAFADPLMGQISDRTRSKFGRRLPWMVLGAPVLSLTFVLLFMVQPITDPKSWFTFLIVTTLNLIMNTAMTMVAIPHLALGNELGEGESQSRTAIYAWRSGMTLLGLLTGILVPAISNAAGFKPVQPELIFAGVISVITLTTTAITVFSTRSSIHVAPKFSANETQKTKNLAKGRVGILMAAFFFATLAQGLNSALAMYYYKFTVQLNEQDVGKVLIIFIVSLCLTLPLWVKLSSTYSKSKLISIGTILLGVFTFIVYPIFPAKELLGPCLMGIVGGILLGSSGLLESMLVDVALEEKIPEASMGSVFGIWKFIAKSARAVAIAGGGQLLTLVGYIPNQATIPSDVSKGISYLFGPVVGILFIAAGLILLKIKPKVVQGTLS